MYYVPTVRISQTWLVTYHATAANDWIADVTVGRHSEPKIFVIWAQPTNGPCFLASPIGFARPPRTPAGKRTGVNFVAGLGKQSKGTTTYPVLLLGLPP